MWTYICPLLSHKKKKKKMLSFKADPMAAILLTFILTISIIFLRSLKWNFNGLPWNWPLFGMIPTVAFNIHRIHDRLTEILRQSSSTFFFKGIWFADMDLLLTVDPSNIHHIMSTNFERYPKGPDFKDIFAVFGDGIFNADGDSWKTQRRTAHALVRQERFLQFLEKSVMEKVKEGLIPVLESVCGNGSVLDLQDLFQRFSFDSTCMFVTGFDLRSLSLESPQIPFSKAMDDVDEVIFLRHFFPKSIWELQKKLQIGQAKRLDEAWKILDEIIATLIASKTESLKLMKTESSEEEEEEGVDLITSYITNKEYDDKFLRDTVLNFMNAGRDGLSSALSWFFFCLSNNPKIEAKITEELKSTIVVPTNDQEEAESGWRIFSIKEVNKLVYFHGALCETMRLYPPIPFQHKVSSQPDILPSGHRVNPKTKIMFSLYALGRMSDVWGEDCLEFKPERWISEKGSVKHEPSYKFLAFNAGPRACLGKEVAFIQMKLAAAVILHNYIITPQIGQQVVPSPSIILHMKHGFKVNVTKRWT